MEVLTQVRARVLAEANCNLHPNPLLVPHIGCKAWPDAGHVGVGGDTLNTAMQDYSYLHFGRGPNEPRAILGIHEQQDGITAPYGHAFASCRAALPRFQDADCSASTA